MKKIGVITFHCAYNYGAVLQALALQKSIEQLGHNVEFIDFRPKAIIDTYKEDVILSSRRAAVYKIIKRKEFVKALNNRKLQHKAFDAFLNKSLIQTKNRYYTTQELIGADLDKDVFICGSDQIWNTNINGNESAYFLSFVKINAKKVAYAASLGVDNHTDEEFKSIKALLSDFTAISMREDIGVELLTNRMGLRAQQVLDPVLLLEPKQWMGIANKIDVMKNRKYIFTYLIGEQTESLKKIYRYAKKQGLPLVYVGIGNLLGSDTVPCEDKSDVGPAEFLGLLINSEYVFTNSFHGMTLSILFNKKFAVIMNQSLNSRLNSLLKMCCLEKQIYEIGTNPNREFFDKIDFSVSNNIIKHQRKSSMQFLEDSIDK